MSRAIKVCYEGGDVGGDVDKYGPFKVNKYGVREYVDENGNPHCVDECGRVYYFDENGSIYYIHSYGISYTIDIDEYGCIYFTNIDYDDDADDSGEYYSDDSGEY